MLNCFIRDMKLPDDLLILIHFNENFKVNKYAWDLLDNIHLTLIYKINFKQKYFLNIQLNFGK